MWRTRLIYIAFLIGMALFFLFYNGWISQFTLVVALCLPALSVLISLPFVLGLKLTSDGELKCPRGGESSVVFNLNKKKSSIMAFCRITVIMEDLMSGTSYTEKLTPTPENAGKVSFAALNSGMYVCRARKAYAYDLLGLFRFRIRVESPTVVTVPPVETAPVPEPDFSAFRSVRMKPKYGGGFSEVHEMREYIPGDQIKQIHWKLSAKTEDLIVREPQEPATRTVVVTFDIDPDRRKMDSILDRLLWVASRLMEFNVAHDIRWINPSDGQLRSRRIENSHDIEEVLAEVMSHPVLEGTFSIAECPFPEANWRYHIGSVTET